MTFLVLCQRLMDPTKQFTNLSYHFTAKKRALTNLSSVVEENIFSPCWKTHKLIMSMCLTPLNNFWYNWWIFMKPGTGWSKSHITHIKIFIGGCNLVQFDWINKHALLLEQSTQVMSCCNLLVPVCQLSSNNRSARMSSSQVQQVFIVEHYLASCSYLTCQNEFRDKFPDSPVPNELTISCLVHFKCHCRNYSPGCIKHEEKSECMLCWMWWTFLTLNKTLFFFWFQCNLFFDK
jgi:hypothetical protein